MWFGVFEMREYRVWLAANDAVACGKGHAAAADGPGAAGQAERWNGWRWPRALAWCWTIRRWVALAWR